VGRLGEFVRDAGGRVPDCYQLFARVMQPLEEVFRPWEKGYPEAITGTLEKVAFMDDRLNRTLKMGEVCAEMVVLKWMRCLFVRYFGWENALALVDYWLL
jgi:hypothetical protein